MKLFWSIRPVNLFIIFLTQWLIYFLYFLPLLDRGIELRFYPQLIWLLIPVTLALAASAYLINDHFDRHTDEVNEKSKKVKASHRLIAYFFIVFAGLGLTTILSQRLENPWIILIYIVLALGLYCYSSIYKKIVFIGNLIVSLFTSLVLLILLLAEYNAIKSLKLVDPREYGIVLTAIIFFSLFTFWINMYRELMKDAEDMEGDRSAQIHTFPLLHGLKLTNRLALIYLLMLLISLIAWALFSLVIAWPLWLGLYYLLCIIIPVVLLIFRSQSLRNRKDYRLAQHYAKALMFSGLIFIVLQAWI